MNLAAQEAETKPVSWGKSFLWLALAVACFNAAYSSIQFPALGWFILGYAYSLVRLTDQPTVRRAFYFGLGTGFLCAASQLFFFWNIFGATAIVLWLVLAFWIGLFTAISCGCIRRWGKSKAVWLIPFIWTGLEYFRSELYYFKFSWLNVGYAFPDLPFVPAGVWGMYSIGFWVFAAAAIFGLRDSVKKSRTTLFGIGLVLLIPASGFLISMAGIGHEPVSPPLRLVGAQLEFPPQGALPVVLDKALQQNPDAPIFVLSEYTLDGPVPDSLKNWCRAHSRYLVVGGEDPVRNDNYYDTAFVVGTNGEVVFKQAKRVPIQFFKDGLPARTQEVWDSPWGKIGFCICYDLSYTRVTDRLVKEGAQLLIIPTMDVEEWGRHEHELHSRVAPVRAAEYGIPIFRVASSGISQAVDGYGNVIARTSIPGIGEILSAQLRLPLRGSFPPDRFLAPFCVVLAGVVLMILLFRTWKNRRIKSTN
ncbi:MAG TPA: nitrilase-related carbon-nitrogen hydrolase [Candidatus Sulfopaludibacter sp.]|nr:nitrilase-related carbon-nitrogen hydrolase [Candidatus Sulfopaludibacter sp.]